MTATVAAPDGRGTGPLVPPGRAGGLPARGTHPPRAHPARVRTAAGSVRTLAGVNEPRDIGPVDYLVVEYTGGTPTGEGLPLLVDLVDRGIIRILDLGFVRRAADGSVEVLELSDLPGGDGLTVFHGVTSGLLAPDDLRDAGTVLAPGALAAVLVYENVWAAPLAAALRRNGAQLVASGRIPAEVLAASAEALAEPAAH